MHNLGWLALTVELCDRNIVRPRLAASAGPVDARLTWFRHSQSGQSSRLRVQPGSSLRFALALLLDGMTILDAASPILGSSSTRETLRRVTELYSVGGQNPQSGNFTEVCPASGLREASESNPTNAIDGECSVKI
jgi:hypothetical protein